MAEGIVSSVFICLNPIIIFGIPKQDFFVGGFALTGEKLFSLCSGLLAMRGKLLKIGMEDFRWRGIKGLEYLFKLTFILIVQGPELKEMCI